MKGNKKRPYSEDKKLIKNERKYGEFTLSFRIPEIYERKWNKYAIENGVLKIEYERDSDDGIAKKKKDINKFEGHFNSL